jgi:penicillin amidase
MKLRIVALVLGASLTMGCPALRLAGYVLFPDPPEFAGGEVIALRGLEAAVDVARRSDGLWRVSAQGERDAFLVLGYLQARDRMAQMDVFRHFARGELAALVGNPSVGEGSVLDLDRLNRFLGFRDRASWLYEATSREEREVLDAFALGVNQWISEGHRAIEHRLIGVGELRPWSPIDSLAIHQFVLHGLSGNANHEVRRLAIACAAGVEALERIWPTNIEFDAPALPEEDWRPEIHAPVPAIVEEVRAELPALCAQGAGDRFDPMPAVEARVHDRFRPAAGLSELAGVVERGWSASNNWAVAGQHTVSGKPVLSSDPHLPHMSPAMLWGYEMEVPGLHLVGFTIAGLHRVAFGHNGRVAWGATTNHVDRQDLVVHRGQAETRGGSLVEGYEVEGRFVPFEYRTELFEVRGAEPVRATVRFTRDGPLLNDLDPKITGKIPLTALRRAPPGRGGDVDASRKMNHATSTAEFAAALSSTDLGCVTFIFADQAGSIALRSPCVLPARTGWRGTFPVPGWLDRYRWGDPYPKEDLPASTDPARGWLAAANSQLIPSSRFPSAYNNDVSPPNRFVRIRSRLRDAIARGGFTAEASAEIQSDVTYERWSRLREELGDGFCVPKSRDASELVEQARHLLCVWDGSMGEASVAATVSVLLTHAVLDRALADELPGGAESELWHYVQSLPQFESNVAWLWSRPETAPVWDDVRTDEVETRTDILNAALPDAIAFGRERYGPEMDGWAWGHVRPFVLRHPLAPEGFLGRFFNSPPIPIDGGVATVFKQHFPRSDRERMHPMIGPLIRFSIDLAEPWGATYSFAGGESGWPRSRFYMNLLEDWRYGRGRPLTPAPSAEDVHVRFVPSGT